MILRLKKRNNKVAVLCKLLLLEVNLMRGGLVEASVSGTITDSDKSRNKALSKSAACLLYIFLMLENESHMRKEYKSLTSLTAKPSTKGITKCLGKLKVCFCLKSMERGTATDVIRWLFSLSDEGDGGGDEGRDDTTASTPGAISSVDVNSTSSTKPAPSVSSAPGELFASDQEGTEDIIVRVVSLARARYSHSSFEPLLLAAQAKITTAEEDMSEEEKTNASAVSSMSGIGQSSETSGLGYLDLVRSQPRPPLTRGQMEQKGDSASTSASAKCVSSGQPEKLEGVVSHADDKNQTDKCNPPQEHCTNASIRGTVPLTQTTSTESGKKIALSSASTAKKKNSLISARMSLNGHRTSLEGRLRSQQITSSVSGMGKVMTSGFSRNNIRREINSNKHDKKNGHIPVNSKANKRQRGGEDSGRGRPGSSEVGSSRGLVQKQLFRPSSSASAVDSRSMPPLPATKAVRSRGGDSTGGSKKRPRPSSSCDFDQWRDSPPRYDGGDSTTDTDNIGSNRGGIVESTPLPGKGRKGVIRRKGAQTGGSDLHSCMQSSVVAETPVRKKPPAGGTNAVVANTPM